MSLATVRSEDGGGILILLDANGDCPAEIGPLVQWRARTASPGCRIEAVVAKCEYETWLGRGGRVGRRRARDPSGYIRPGGSRVDPGRQGVAPQPDARVIPLPPARRSGRVDRAFRHGVGAQTFAVLRQDVASHGRVVAVSRRARCRTRTGKSLAKASFGQSGTARLHGLPRTLVVGAAVAPDRVTRRPPRRSSKQTGGMLLPRTVHHLLLPLSMSFGRLPCRRGAPLRSIGRPRRDGRREEAEARPAARGDDALQRMIADRE